jgi:methionyl aminopeptidase
LIFIKSSLHFFLQKIMIHYKTRKEQAIMIDGGKYLREVLNHLLEAAQPGVLPVELDALAERLLRKTGGSPSFMEVSQYHWSTCMCINDVVVHGIPGKTPIAPGDVVGIDVGLFYKGFHTDTSWSVLIPESGGAIDTQKQALLKTGERALEKAIAQAIVGNRVGHISEAMQHHLEPAGYGIVEHLVGHGVGRTLHEEPEVPGLLLKPIDETAKIKTGMALAIEAIYTMGNPDTVVDDDNWTIRTKDGTIAGLFEKTIIVQDTETIVVT